MYQTDRTVCTCRVRYIAGCSVFKQCYTGVVEGGFCGSVMGRFLFFLKWSKSRLFFFFFFFKQRTAYEVAWRLVGSEMCISDDLTMAWSNLDHAIVKFLGRALSSSPPSGEGGELDKGVV